MVPSEKGPGHSREYRDSVSGFCYLFYLLIILSTGIKGMAIQRNFLDKLLEGFEEVIAR